ncbi:hypothetical protein Bphy_1230 [Paraburkholderia phymatum STM815]|uniref:Uncharacterized protein n=1 Tax=Paraburkholderia phymatum (strain DSM 17167 / CIP 108236 / LMG 21445 / STM815) TaxID=391038 RepID=B2JHS1_PARP8|nr:hypothetical protein Bphy_1230 [Paraburkholderia phymatum STM815]
MSHDIPYMASRYFLHFPNFATPPLARCLPDTTLATPYFVLSLRAVHVAGAAHRECLRVMQTIGAFSAITHASAFATTACSQCYMFCMCASAHVLLFVRARANSFNAKLQVCASLFGRRMHRMSYGIDAALRRRHARAFMSV